MQVYSIFFRIDGDDSGFLSKNEFFEHCKFEETEILAHRIFQTFDYDSTNFVNFIEVLNIIIVC